MGVGRSTVEEIIDNRLRKLNNDLENSDPQESNKILKEIKKLQNEKENIEKQTWHDDTSRIDQVKGLDEIKVVLKSACVLPNKQPQLFENGDIEKLNKILLYGPPGTGKTLLAESAAIDSGCIYQTIKMSNIGSKYVFETENSLEQQFDEIVKNKTKQYVVFMDEIDSIGTKRKEDEQQFYRSLKTTLFQILDNVPKNCIFIACTNFLDQLDLALLRRFDIALYVRLPDEETRIELINQFLKNKKHSLKEEDIKIIAQKTQLYSGSDIGRLIKKALQVNLEDLLRCTSFKREEDGLYYPCDDNDPKVEKISVIKIPNNCLGKPKELTKYSIISSLSLIKPTSTLNDIIKGAPDYIKKQIEEKYKIHEKSKSDDQKGTEEDKIMELTKIGMEILNKPPENLREITRLMSVIMPQVDKDLFKDLIK